VCNEMLAALTAELSEKADSPRTLAELTRVEAN